MASGTSASKSPSSFTRPPEWSDEERMSYLLAPFPPNKIPSPNDSKVTFWSSLIVSSSKELNKAMFTERELLTRLKWKQITSPSCLSLVIESMERAGTIVKLSTFYQTAASGGSWLSWGLGVVTKPMSWAVKNYLPSSSYEGEYIVTALVKEYASAIAAEHEKSVVYKSTDNLLTYVEFAKLCQGVISPEVQPVLEHQLLKDCKIARRKEVVKFSSSHSRPEVTDSDIGIVSIKEAVEHLVKQVHSLEERSERLIQLARERVCAKDRQGALKHLRRNKVIKESLNKREPLLDNLQNILHQIQMAETDIMVYQAYKNGAATLKSMRESEGLTVESAEEAVLSLQEVVQESEEIASVLCSGVDDENQETDEDLEAELCALLSSEESSAVQAPAKAISPSMDEGLLNHLSSLKISEAEIKDSSCESEVTAKPAAGSNHSQQKIPIPA